MESGYTQNKCVPIDRGHRQISAEYLKMLLNKSIPQCDTIVLWRRCVSVYLLRVRCLRNGRKVDDLHGLLGVSIGVAADEYAMLTGHRWLHHKALADNRNNGHITAVCAVSTTEWGCCSGMVYGPNWDSLWGADALC